MKQTQLAGAVVALAVMVFVITFAMNYIGGNNQPKINTTASPRRPVHSLTLHSERSNDPPLECESRTKGHRDFWFSNDNDEPVMLGLSHKSCSCGSVKLFVPPPDLQGQIRSLLTEGVALGLSESLAPRATGGGLEAIRAVATLSQFQSIQNGTTAQDLLDGEKISIPARASGWIRLSWSGSSAPQLRLTAFLWMDRNELEQQLQLEALLAFHQPVRVRPELVMSKELKDEDLPYQQTIKVWSSTRKELHLTAEADLNGKNPDSDPFVVGAPEPMKADELKQLEQDNKETSASANFNPHGPVLCGYRIPVTLNKVSRDGTTPFDLGPFRRSVVISAPDTGAEPLKVTVTGRVRGIISLVGEEEGGVNLGTFRSARGAELKTTLRAENRDLNLELDRTRTPAYLDATVTRVPENTDKGPWLWNFKITVKPNAVNGSFPRRDDIRYHDSAIYLKASYPKEPPRAIRIPVSGAATER